MNERLHRNLPLQQAALSLSCLHVMRTSGLTTSTPTSTCSKRYSRACTPTLGNTHLHILASICNHTQKHTGQHTSISCFFASIAGSRLIGGGCPASGRRHVDKCTGGMEQRETGI
ncbi:unnamed protein product [Protopolystoma xenopodis]|uniref:Uncharacterized protein n=1 Tax=Protopolystoma xenopodis TaxID=117903 RepID=A0A3S5CD18_9PLAT|nr:unnamed protein product [Protopolystoma xenopodis]